MAEPHKRSLGNILSGWARRNAQKPWLPPALTAFPAVDFILPFMPNQLLLAGLSMLAPNRWPVFAIAFATGTAFGGGAVAFGLQSLGLNVSHFIPDGPTNSELVNTIGQFQIYGLWFLAAIALLPWTPRLSVVACAIAGFEPLTIFCTLFLARLLPNATLGAIGARGPGIIAPMISMQRTRKI